MNLCQSLSKNRLVLIARLQPELDAPRVVEQVLNLRMLLHVGGEERADWDDLQSALAGRIEAEADESGAHAFALMFRRHFGVREHDLPGGESVLRNCERTVAKIGFKAVAFGIVAHGDLGLRHYIRIAGGKRLRKLVE